MNKLTVKDIDVKGKKCLVRVDFNVPVKDNVITDENRITGALPTIKYLMDNGAKVILCSHLGRPKGGVAAYADNKKKYSLKVVADRLNQLLGNKITFADDVIGEKAEACVNACKEGEVVLLENLRFYDEETNNDKGFCEKLARFGDVYVSDAFGTVHRAHASTAGIVQYGFIKTAVAGFLIEKELEIMAGALEAPKRPFVAILGGAKVSDKIGVINNLIDKVDSLIIGGGMAFTFFKALGYSIGKSICEEDKLDLAKELLAKAAAKGVKLLLPLDNVIADAFSNDANIKTVDHMIPDGWMGLDIGEQSIEAFSKVIDSAKTVIWNGPMGVFEMSKYAAGTKAVAAALAASSAITIIGGGDSAAAVTQLGYADKMTHISTGGGASLELMEGIALPGIECLNKK
ncbi:MAG: phosphoglycerate kinase [Clostridia bacterium]|nr:phosphoglycerate kinase [Clostridia bacterium]